MSGGGVLGNGMGLEGDFDAVHPVIVCGVAFEFVVRRLQLGRMECVDFYIEWLMLN